jgi:hypothetical protein
MTFGTLIVAIVSLLTQKIFPLLITLIVLATLWGLFLYIFKKDSGGADLGRHVTVAGVVSLFAVLSFWGLAAILINTFLVP